MKPTYQHPRIAEGLKLLLHRIHHGEIGYHPDQASMPEWRGAGVVVSSGDNLASTGFRGGLERLVVTRHAKSLTWLLLELRDLFGDEVDASNKYGFYAQITEAVAEREHFQNTEGSDPRPLLWMVLEAGFRVHLLLEENGFLPSDPTVVVDFYHESGVQRNSTCWGAN